MNWIHEGNAIRRYNDNGQVDAEITYEEEGSILIANHTFVDSSLRGQGIAKKLVDNLADFARKNNKKIHPTCHYVVKLFEKYTDYGDVKI